MATRDNSLVWEEHTKECPLHNDLSLRTCFGVSRRGKRCTKKYKCSTIAESEGDFLPTCVSHVDQKMFLTKCRATMHCGWRCGRLLELKPHGFHLCHQHNYPHGTHAPCYFLKVPLEIRIRIYGFLLPDLDIPADFPPRCNPGSNFRSDRCPTSTSILRVNRQIYDEGTRCLYGSRKFGIRIENGNITFCNTTDRFILNDFPLSVTALSRGNHALQDYQMQLMLREQQNKTRLMMARVAAENSTSRTGQEGGNHALQDYQMQLMLLEQQNKKRLIMAREEVLQRPDKGQTLHEMSLKFPISGKGFNQIHSFNIAIFLEDYFPPAGVQSQLQAQASAHPQQIQQMQQQYYQFRISDNIQECQAWERKVYGTIDLIHMLISDLQSTLVNHPLTRLSVSLRLGNVFKKREEAVPAAILLLKPFLLLRNVLNPEIASITFRQAGYNPANMEIDLIDPAWSPSQQDQELSTFLQSWHETLSLPLFPAVISDSETQPNKNNWPLPISPIITAYDSLSTFIIAIRTHCNFTLSQEREILDFLHSARVAREAEDMTSFKEAWELVVQVWLGYLERERCFERRVEGMMGDLFGLVEGG